MFFLRLLLQVAEMQTQIGSYFDMFLIKKEYQNKNTMNYKHLFVKQMLEYKKEQKILELKENIGNLGKNQE